MTQSKHHIRPHVWALAVCLIGGAIIGLDRGQSNFWDLLNYHLYNPWALFHDRGRKDIFAAGIQGYFDPYLDIPFYLASMVWFAREPRVVAALEGLPFGLLIFATIATAQAALNSVLPKEKPLRGVVLGIVTLTAITGASTWSQAVSTTNEVFVSAIVLAGVAILIRQFGPPDQAAPETVALKIKRAALIGALIGVAPGLKLTAAVYAPAAGIIVLASCRNWKQIFSCGLAFFVGWLAFFLISYGPWALHLYGATGNPFFPMFNNIFHSRLAAPGVGRDVRNLPQTWIGWMFAPFYWLDDHTLTVMPFEFRDARFAAGLVASCCLLAMSVITWSRKRTLRNAPLTALAGFWFLGYVTWLVMFSMLRYAIVLEVIATIIYMGALLQLAGRFWRDSPALPAAQLVATAGTALLVIGFATVPDIGYVRFGRCTFDVRVPNLGQSPLVVLGNQPMGMLVPFIVKGNPDATFVGIPGCFAKGQWCNTTFLDEGIGKAMRRKIAAHRGPIYVAYYADRIPTMPQLKEFGITFDSDGCRVIRTNRTPKVDLCAAHYAPTVATIAQRNKRYHLAVSFQEFVAGVHLVTKWKENPCTLVAKPAVLQVGWAMPPRVRGVHVYLSSPPSPKRMLFTSGRQTGEATTGPWVTASQRLIITDTQHRTLAQLGFSYVACNAGPMSGRLPTLRPLSQTQ